MKTMKVTITRLNKLAKNDNYTAKLLLEIIQQANTHDELVADGFDASKTGSYAFNEEDGICIIVHNDYDKRVLSGLRTWNERLIETTFTLGLNQCRILDINKLAKTMFDRE